LTQITPRELTGLRRLAMNHWLMRRPNAITNEQASPWFEHPRFGDRRPLPPETGSKFRASHAQEVA
ncbi:MAG: hypothetical protein O6951_08110, partial [Actinobacteria bacterium]|nr:hypothetical protein [Actinomycetota bacterium]